MKERSILQHVIEREDGKPKIIILGADDQDKIDLSVHHQNKFGQGPGSITTQIDEGEIEEVIKALKIHLKGIRSRRLDEESGEDIDMGSIEGAEEDIGEGYRRIGE
jgi:hypothetical protein